MQWSGNLGGFFPANGMMPAAPAQPDPLTTGAGLSASGALPVLLENRESHAPRPVRQVTKSPNVVALARARLREVKSELRRMKALEKERAELERLLAAAKPPRAKREPKRSAG